MFCEKEIRKKIKGIKNTQKITKAMEMISAVKMKKSKNIMISNTIYYNNLIKIINNIKSINLDHEHPYFKKRTIKKVGFLIISTDRGLCGSLNNNLFKLALNEIKKLEQKNIKYELSIIGNKGILYFTKLNFRIINQINNLNVNPKIYDVISIIKFMINLYNNNKIDKFIILGNKFINTIYQNPTIFNLLPLIQKNKNLDSINWNYIYEPNSQKVLNIILNRYLESRSYQIILENIVSEQSARMMAMKTATDNGENLIKQLNLSYNKIRQANITQEVNEIVSGSNY